jgi:cholesterol transport system auxiliary component
MNRIGRRVVLAGLALTPAACTSLLPEGGAPPKLYTLTPATEFPAGGVTVSWQLLIATPSCTAALDSERIALSRSPTTLDYFADAAWIDRAPRMVQALLVQSFENSGRIAAVASDSMALRADYLLEPELRHFEADYGTAAAPAARVEIAARLIRVTDHAIRAHRSFAASVAAAENRMPAIVDAFNAALHQAARQLVDWTLGAAQ